MKSKLEEAFGQLKIEVLAAGLRWVEPIFTPLNDHPDEGYSWCGRGPQGKELCRLSMWCGHDDKVVSFTTSNESSKFEDEEDHFGNYKQYLQLNGWL